MNRIETHIYYRPKDLRRIECINKAIIMEASTSISIKYFFPQKNNFEFIDYLQRIKNTFQIFFFFAA